MAPSPARDLAVRLRELRKKGWPDSPVTQPMLAKALGVSVPLISSWENRSDPKLPPSERLAGYARFFATPRSIASGRPALVDDLTESEETLRADLERELLALRAGAVGPHGGDTRRAADLGTAPAAAGPWHFGDTAPVTIVCGSVRRGGPQIPQDSPDYVELDSYADLDALLELHGHIRAANPDSLVTFHDEASVTRDHLTTHLVLLGGVDRNPFTAEVLGALGVPVVQRTGDTAAFEVTEGGHHRRFRPAIRTEAGRRVLVEDVAHFCRGVNPYNQIRTVTVCGGMFGRGTYGAVRTLTDTRFRDRNAAHVRTRFPAGRTFSILARVKVVLGEVVTPDWTRPDMVLHEWSDAAE